MLIEDNVFNIGDRFKTGTLGAALAYIDHYNVERVDNEDGPAIRFSNEQYANGWQAFHSPEGLFVLLLRPIYSEVSLFNPGERKFIGWELGGKLDHVGMMENGIRSHNEYIKKKRKELEEEGKSFPRYLEYVNAKNVVTPIVMAVWLANGGMAVINASQSKWNEERILGNAVRDYRKTLWILRGLDPRTFPAEDGNAPTEG